MVKFTLILGAVLFFLAGLKGHACVCVTTGPAIEYNRAKAVFIGKMLGGTEILTNKNSPGEIYTIEAGKIRFSVEEIFKGNLNAEVTVEAASGKGTSCDYGLIRNQRYLVYAYGNDSSPDVLYTGVCTRTVEVDTKYAKEDLDFLRNLPPPGSGGTLKGFVQAGVRIGKFEPMAGVKVQIQLPGDQAVQATTDKDGRFEVRKLTPGKYSVELELPENYEAEQKSEQVAVDDRGTAEISFKLHLH